MRPEDIARLISEDIRTHNGLLFEMPEEEEEVAPVPEPEPKQEDPRLAAFSSQRQKAPSGGGLIVMRRGTVIEANLIEEFGDIVKAAVGKPYKSFTGVKRGWTGLQQTPNFYKATLAHLYQTGDGALVNKELRDTGTSPHVISHAQWVQNRIKAGKSLNLDPMTGVTKCKTFLIERPYGKVLSILRKNIVRIDYT